VSNRPPEPPKNGLPTKIPPALFWALALFAVLMVFYIMAQASLTSGRAASLNDIVRQIQDDRVRSITIVENLVEIELNDNTRLNYFKQTSDDLEEQLLRRGITEEQINRIIWNTRQPNNMGDWLNFIIVFGVIIFGLFLVSRLTRSMRMGQDQTMNFGRSRARVTRDAERPQVTFGDVAGATEAKEELKEIVEFLKEPEKFIRLGARVPKGVLMVGPPGTGKTLMARAVAGEAGVPFFSISGSEFVEMFVGVGASRVRDLFERAKSESPAIIFIDEIDAVGRQRGAGLGGGHDEREQTLNQILVEMDGFETGTNVIIIAATNRPDILDPALLRPGRFDRKVMMDNPDIKGRLEILNVHAKGKPFASDVDLESIAKITPGFSGADLENLINEAAILAARRNKKTISMSELQESMERSIMGPERKSRVISDRDKHVIAYHEAGHALLHHLLEFTDPVHKITIIPRGRAGGYVLSLPEDGAGVLRSREWFEDTIVAALGGRAAEELVYNQFTTGASSDLQRVTQLARSMVTQYGMSEKMGPRTFGGGSGSLFLGRDLYEQRDYSEQAAEMIDQEVNRIVTQAYERAHKLLTEYRQKMEDVVKILLEQETLERSDFEGIMGISKAGSKANSNGVPALGD
jgi:cell division protease FtsH